MTIGGLTPQFGQVGPPWWSDRPVFLIGGGPSLASFDLNRLHGRGCLCGINESMLIVKCHAGLSIDERFVTFRHSALEAFAATAPLYLSMGGEWWHDVAPVPGAVNLHNDSQAGLSVNPAVLRHGQTSGCAAVNLATLKRARRIVLLGYDYRHIAGREHHHDNYSWAPIAERHWSTWARNFDAVATSCKMIGVEVVNASPFSAIECFQKMSIEHAMEWACATNC